MDGTFADVDAVAVDLPSPAIVWTLPGGREIPSSGAPGLTAEALAASVIAAGIVPPGTPWRQVGEDYVIPPTIEELAMAARAERDRLLAATDYLMMPDYPLDADDRAKVSAYRQALRDITAQGTFPESISWPQKPEGV